MKSYFFGSGQLYGLTAAGVPLKAGALQDVNVEFSGDVKMLHGQEQFALATARGKSKIEGKANFGQFDPEIFNELFFGQTVSEGMIKQARNEAGSVPGSVAYTVTVANDGSDFEQDLGVWDVLTGNPLKQVASSPGDGEYTVSSTGLYTFNVAQAGRAMLFNYLYSDSTTGQTLDISNQLMGTIPTFGLVLSGTHKGRSIILQLYSCVSDKLSHPFKQDDYAVNEIGFSAQANDAGQVGRWSIG